MKQKKLENVAINDVLPLKAARRYAITKGKCFWAAGTSDLISMVVFAFAMRRHLIRYASGPFTSFRLAKFRWVPFADLRVQRLATKQDGKIYGGCSKTPVLF